MPTFLGPYDFQEIPREILMRNLMLLDTTIDSENASGSFNLGDITTPGTNIVQIIVKISEAFDGVCEVTVGTNFEPSLYVLNDDIDLSLPGFYVIPLLEELTTAVQLKVYFIKGFGVTQGKLEVFAIIAN
ncbi:hypothetical protein [Leptospira jelokensis]|uniref:Uncharacterized protein n=1 Tax=Leptospira jelokensis TaxID=2484931 RepID=A0A4Z0ZPQ8_9LEPT|nr:hypothetical protein [Leptospira jelokensis]TGL58624.1 hypothetical protein EHQ62_17160 [Leptospira jelokensis]